MSDCRGIREHIQEFDHQHGQDAILIDDYWWLYSDGAMREHNPFGQLIDPPTDINARSKLQVRYCEAQLHKATEEFDTLKSWLMRDPNAWQRSEHHLQRLGELQTAVKERMRNLSKARTRMIRSDPNGNHTEEGKRRSQIEAEWQTKKYCFKDAVKKIEV